jgi:hypothetical protein
MWPPAHEPKLSSLECTLHVLSTSSTLDSFYPHQNVIIPSRIFPSKRSLGNPSQVLLVQSEREREMWTSKGSQLAHMNHNVWLITWPLHACIISPYIYGLQCCRAIRLIQSNSWRFIQLSGSYVVVSSIRHQLANKLSTDSIVLVLAVTSCFARVS